MSELADYQAEEELAKLPAALTLDQVEQIDKKWQEEQGINRRVLLTLLTHDGEGLAKAALDEPAAIFDAFECGVNYLNRLKDLVELMQASSMRLMIGLCAVDWRAEDSPFTQEQYWAVCSQLHGKSPTDET